MQRLAKEYLQKKSVQKSDESLQEVIKLTKVLPRSPISNKVRAIVQKQISSKLKAKESFKVGRKLQKDHKSDYKTSPSTS